MAPHFQTFVFKEKLIFVVYLASQILSNQIGLMGSPGFTHNPTRQQVQAAMRSFIHSFMQPPSSPSLFSFTSSRCTSLPVIDWISALWCRRRDMYRNAHRPEIGFYYTAATFIRGNEWRQGAADISSVWLTLASVLHCCVNTVCTKS